MKVRLCPIQDGEPLVTTLMATASPSVALLAPQDADVTLQGTGVGVAVGGMGVAVGGTGVFVAVGCTAGVLVGGTVVAVGCDGAVVGVAVGGGTVGVAVGCGVAVGAATVYVPWCKVLTVLPDPCPYTIVVSRLKLWVEVPAPTAVKLSVTICVHWPLPTTGSLRKKLIKAFPAVLSIVFDTVVAPGMNWLDAPDGVIELSCNTAGLKLSSMSAFDMVLVVLMLT